METARLQELNRKNLARSCGEISFTWVLLILALYAETLANTIFIKIALFVFIATRQYALLILMHEGVHQNLSSNKKLNDFISQYFLAYPFGALFFNGRERHLKHHKLFATQDDPDLKFYGINKKSRSDSLPFSVIKEIFFSKYSERSQKVRSLVRMIFVQMVIFLGLLMLTGKWDFYPVFWVLPIGTFVLAFDKIRLYCEHAPLDQTSDDIPIRTFRCSFLERFFLAPFDVNYHFEHHLFPGVPHYNLKRIENAKIKDSTEWSYVALLRRFFRHQPLGG